MTDQSNSTPSEPDARSSGLDFPVVGLGASAGGLAALVKCFEHMNAAPDMAFVVILHLSPHHESNAAAILQHATRMPVTQVQGQVAIERNHVYVIPPTHGLSMYDGHLGLSHSQLERGRHVAIDVFFRTLAEAHRERAVGVVLSGTGSDGAVGIARIKELGGIVIAQSPSDAEYSGMPDSAIATGKVDIVLPVVDIPQKLLELWQNARGIELPTPEVARLNVLPPSSPEAAEEALRGIMALLHKRTGHDFRHYKRATVLRRVERRLQVNGLPNLPAYLTFLNGRVDEADALLGDMLIGVTNFFRDREAFEALERDVIPALFADPARQGEQLRVWVPGCSTGEEAYTLAVLLSDEALRAERPREMQIFGSDIDEQGLATARAAKYSKSILTDVPPAYLRGYFNDERDGYRVKDGVRKKLLFAMHNLLRDPPFSRLDLVSCRNLLIYLNRDVQKDILQIFHFALKPGGYLFLGSSETADAMPKLFTAIDKKHRIYRANAVERTLRSVPNFPLSGADHKAVRSVGLVSGKPKASMVGDLHQQLMLDDYTPASVIVDHNAEIVHLSFGADRFLRFAEGSPSNHLISLVEPELRAELRAALFESIQGDTSVTGRPVTLRRGDKAVEVSVSVRPVRLPQWPPNLTLVLFVETDERPATDTVPLQAGTRDPVVMQLEDELHRKTEQLQTTIEQYETSCEDLKASNEELQAINEELRSATEELETSKEELQSTNEELVTVNQELKSKVEEADQVNDDLQNLISATEIATVFVDPQMVIKRYTPAARSIFNIIDGDVGRSLLDITHRLEYADLADDAAATFASLRVVEREVRNSDGRWFLARILPYRTSEDRIGGAVLTFVDISGRMLAENRMHIGEARMQLIAESMPDFAILTLDVDGRLTSWNTGAERIFGHLEGEILGQPIDVLFTPEDRAAGVPEAEMRRARESGRAMDERWHLRKDGTRFYASGAMAPLRRGGLQGYAKIARDMTASHQQASLGAAARADAEASARMKDEFLAVMSHELKHPLNLIHVNAQLLLNLPEARNMPAVQRAGSTIERSVAAQTRIIDDLLDLSRTQSGKLTIECAPVDLPQALEASLRWADEQSRAKSVAFSQTGFDKPLLVFADVVRVEQIVWNLLSNAIKFTAAGGAIAISVRQDGDAALIEVKDNGRGIAADFLPHVFGMFLQEENYTTRREGGLGIGLGLVQGLVALHGGRVEAESPGPGRGATFKVWLPLHERTDFAPLPEPPLNQERLTGVRLLLVDDTLDTLESFATLLELEGAEVTSANSGAEALAISEQRSFDLIVSDIGMPVMDGNQLIAQLRRRPATQLVPAIALTGYGRPQDVQAALVAGFTAHLTKPIDLDKMCKLVLGLLPKQRRVPTT